MVVWVANRSREVIKRYLNEETYKLVKYGYFAIYKRAGTTCAEELEDIKIAISKGIKGEVIEDEKHILRAGHGGILDSMATGVLAVALCDGCKVLPVMLQSNKRYTVTARLGIATDSYNISGNVVAEASYEHVTKPSLENALKEFVGEIWQKPPVFSALKLSGRRASDIARAGGEVNLITRPVTCYAAHCLRFEPPFFTLDVSCGHGFYVRSLIHDLARAVGSCGHVTALERTKHGPFTLKDCLQPKDFNLDSIVSAICEARRNHPKLAQYIENYWKIAKNVKKENSGQKHQEGEGDNKNNVGVRNRVRERFR